MKLWALAVLGLVAVPAMGFAAPLTGDYVEARTASVFAGACHYSGEYVSDGREGIMAWRFDAGDWNGVPLAGCSAIAVVRGDRNLGDPAVREHALLYVGANADALQKQAIWEALLGKCAIGLGGLNEVSSGAIQFELQSDGGFEVNAPGVARLSIKPMPNRECCTMPNLVWYKPLAPVMNRMVGYTQLASCTRQTGGDAIKRGNENSAFYGTFKY